MKDLVRVKASEFYSFAPEVRDGLRELKGGLVINDCFWEDFGTRERIKLFYGGYGCFSPEQMVLTESGSKPISEVKIGDRVPTFNIKTNTREAGTVKNVFRYENDKETFRITLVNGRTIVATHNHKFMFGGRWVSIKEIINFWNGRNVDLEENTKLQPVRSEQFWAHKNLQLEKQGGGGDCEIRFRWERLFKNRSKRGRRQESYRESASDNMRHVSWRCNGNDSPSQRPHKNKQSSNKSYVDVAGRKRTGSVSGWVVFHPQGAAGTHFNSKRKSSHRNKAKVCSEKIYPGNAIQRVWRKGMHHKRYSGAQELELASIASVEIVNDCPVVYDLEVHNNHNYYLDCGKGILVHNSGKSIFIVQDLIEKCRHDKYFKCYYGRKVFDTVRGSCFETIVETIEDLGLEDEFHYSKAVTSSMVIVHKPTGNKFVPFGADKPDKLKSIKDPTHIWCEEFDQFEDANAETGRKGDFQVLFPRLRTIKAPTQFIASFNTDPVYPSHWILKYFFPELYEGDDKAEFEILEGVEVTKTFANYTDNHFIDQEAYYQQLKLASGGSTTILEAIARGAWGVLLNKDPWLYAFDINKHVKPTLPFMPTFPIYVFIDVNNDPLECTIWQMSPLKGGASSFIHCIDEFSGKYKVAELGPQIRAKYPSSIIFLGGDRSGQNEDVGRNQTVYQILAGAIGSMSDKQLLLNTHNLEHSDSRLLCNAMIHNYPNFYISAANCPNLIKQCQIAKVDIKSSTPSKLLKDRGMYKMDAFDSMRYMFQTLFNEFAKKTYFKLMSKSV